MVDGGCLPQLGLGGFGLDFSCPQWFAAVAISGGGECGVQGCAGPQGEIRDPRATGSRDRRTHLATWPALPQRLSGGNRPHPSSLHGADGSVRTSVRWCVGASASQLSSHRKPRLSSTYAQMPDTCNARTALTPISSLPFARHSRHVCAELAWMATALQHVTLGLCHGMAAGHWPIGG